MFEPGSRYFTVETTTLTVTGPDGEPRVIAYTRRRLIPSRDAAVVLAEHTVSQGERLDHITARYIGDPTQFWRICDANNVLRPVELEEVGRTVRIDMPRV